METLFTKLVNMLQAKADVCEAVEFKCFECRIFDIDDSR